MYNYTLITVKYEIETNKLFWTGKNQHDSTYITFREVVYDCRIFYGFYAESDDVFVVY